MDARSTTHRSGSSGSFEIAKAAFAFLVIVANAVAGPPPSIHASGGRQTITITDTTQPALFPEQVWHLVAPNPLGPTIAVWSIEPFRNSSSPDSPVDAGLYLTIRDKGQSSHNWGSIIPQARTSFRTGLNTAHVVAGSAGGVGQVGITVSFLCNEQPAISDGNYEAIVVGTITEGF